MSLTDLDGGSLVFVGTYTESRSEGIFVFRLDPATGRLTAYGAAAAGPNPTYLALHPTLRRIYAVNEAAESPTGAGGTATALHIEDGGSKLVLSSRQPTDGLYPCHVGVHPSLTSLLVANYRQGKAGVSAIGLTASGELTPPTDHVRDEAENNAAHCIVTDSTGQYVFFTDLRQNGIFVRRFDAASGKFAPHSPGFVPVGGKTPQLPRGPGPRHLVFSSDDRFLYCVNEYASTVTTFAWEPTVGSLTEVQALSTLPDDFDGKENTGAATCLASGGRYLYASNRGHDSLVLYSVDRETGRLTAKARFSTGGKHPRDFCFDPTGDFVVVANKDSSNLIVFRVDRASGHLTTTGETASVPLPVCVKIVPIARYAGDQ